MTPFRLLFAVLFVSTSAMTAPLAGDVRDSHKLSPDERRAFISAICSRAVATKNQFHCTGLHGYPTDGAAFDEGHKSASGDISLDAIAYGHFTAARGQEAYITYDGLEPHSNDFGGGILLQGVGSGWKVVRWFPGGQMDHCVGLPENSPQRMLCLSDYTGMGETDSSVWVINLSGPGGALKRTSVLKAQDGREASNTGDYCKSAAAAHESMLLSIDDLTRSSQSGILAISRITYATAADVRDACKTDGFADVGTQSGVVRYRFSRGKIMIDPPPRLAPVDY